MNNRYRPIYNNGVLPDTPREEIVRELTWYKENGYGGFAVNGTTQITDGISAGMGIDIKSLIMGALGGKLVADAPAPVVVVQPEKEASEQQEKAPESK